jgi:hypothetical protein
MRITGKSEDTGKLLGLDKDWMVKAVKAVGNYGEMFERNVGPKTALNLPRGLNNQWCVPFDRDVEVPELTSGHPDTIEQRCGEAIDVREDVAPASTTTVCEREKLARCAPCSAVGHDKIEGDWDEQSAAYGTAGGAGQPCDQVDEPSATTLRLGLPRAHRWVTVLLG